MWASGANPVAARPCELWLRGELGLRPLPTMQLGVIAARAIALGRRAARELRSTVVLEVYPRASLHRLSARDPRLATRQQGEPIDLFRARVIDGFGDLVEGLPEPAELTMHEIDAIVAAYTAWLSPHGLLAPPEGWPGDSGWIAVPA